MIGTCLIRGLGLQHLCLECLDAEVLHGLEGGWLGRRRYRGVRLRQTAACAQLVAITAAALVAIRKVLEPRAALQDRLMDNATRERQGRGRRS